MREADVATATKTLLARGTQRAAAE